MAIKVRIPTALRSYADNQREVALDGKTVGEVVDGLASAHPGLKTHLFDEKGVLRSFVNVYLNNEDVREQNGQATPVNDGDTLIIVPSVAGG